MTRVYLIHYQQVEWCLSAAQSVMSSDIPIRLTVVNNSPECGDELERGLPAGTEIVETRSNLGYTGGANVALGLWMVHADEFAVIASHDLHVAPSTFRTLRICAEAHPNLGVLGPQLNRADSALAPACADSATNTAVDEVSWLSGTCLLLRRACIEEIGGFDEALGSYSEDVDICWRAAAAGWMVARSKAAVASGRGSGAPEARDAAWINGVRVKRLHFGYPAAAAEFGRLAIGWGRCAIGSVHPRRTVEARHASRRRFRALSRALRDFCVIWAEPQIQVDIARSASLNVHANTHNPKA